MNALSISLLLSVVSLLPIRAASSGSELLAALQARIDRGGDYADVYDAVDDLPDSEVKELYKQVERAWPRLQEKYISNFQRTARSSSGKAGEHKSRVRDLRKELAAMKSLGDGPMKDALKKRGMPILDELRDLLLPSAKTILATSDETLKKERRGLLAIAGLRDALIEAAIIPGKENSVSQVETLENSVTQALSGLDRKGLKLMEQNRKTAEKAKVPEAERLGVADANLMRLLAGYNALEIDPKLCAAGRDHSKDMATLGFFAHESPVAGKKTPFIRANNFGTSASGENIYMGSTDPKGANKAWFYSPGHHRNMFNGSHRRIGLGQHDRHWTQLFGS
ncbi:MAG: CAP domain-containing protein [Akkermansiaceae bacterium]|nr:CAP domain-containing protein [Akkermansiaceae bacterium]